MQIATWNINGLRARKEYLLRWLRDRQPDVIGLQEIKITDEDFPFDVFHDMGYQVATHGQKAWNGVAILSRKPLKITQVGLPGQEGLGARLISADIGSLSFTTVYVPNGKDVHHEDFLRKLAWLDALVDHLKEHLRHRKAAIVCGDFNICPAPIDSWNGNAFHGRIFHTDEERTRFQRLCMTEYGCFSSTQSSPGKEISRPGLVDVYREQFPDMKAFSWWDYRGGSFHKGQGLRIDFLLATPQAYANLVSVTIDREYRKKKDELTSSDHAPVVAWFNHDTTQ